MSSLDEGENEQWFETVERVVNGTYNMQKQWIEQHELGWNPWKAQRSAQEMFDRIFHMKFLPPGRGLWAMGSPLTEQRGLYAALNNCFTMDHQLLTEDGFLFYHQIMQRLRDGVPVRAACYLSKEKRVEYRDIGVRDMLLREGEHTIVDLKSEDGTINMSVTADHDLFVRLDEKQGWHKTKAINLLDPQLQAQIQAVDLLAHVEDGVEHENVASQSSPSAFDALSLKTEDEQLAFLEWYGYWIQSKGSLNMDERCITFNVPNPHDTDYVDRLLERLPLDQQQVKKDPIMHSTSYSIHDKLWFDYFVSACSERQEPSSSSSSPELPPHSDTSTPTSHHRLPTWMMTAALDKKQLRALINGLSASPSKHDDNDYSHINASSVVLRDQIVHLLLHAGYTTHFSKIDPCLNDDVNDILTKQDEWRIRYSDNETSKVTSLNLSRDISSRTFHGQVWCVNVPTDDHLIIVRKVLQCGESEGENEDAGERERSIDRVSRPLIVGNCAFVTTEGIEKEDDKSKPFTFLMDASMLGVGVGFDTKGAGKLLIKGAPSNPDSSRAARKYVIADSREGWVDALRQLMLSYIHGRESIEFDYSLIRPYGSPIRGFGGVASGPAALKELLDCVRDILIARTGSCLTITDITDIMNLIGRCVVAGNVRRTAEIGFGPADDEEWLDLKDYDKNPRRAAFGWTSNNSVFATLGMNYKNVCNRVRRNGEPGFMWLDNMQNYARMNGSIDRRDHRVRGGNPCLEQSLESYELCCLVETFPTNHTSYDDYQRTLKFAYLYAKTVTLGKTHWPETNRVMLRNRRIGCSVSGVAQFISQHGLHTLQQWLEQGYAAIQHYDKEYSDWFAIPRSIKTTSVKPSGTVSLLAGATPGMHYPESRFYIRRIRMAANSELLPPMREAGYPIEPVVDGHGSGSSADSSGKAQAPQTVVVEIPVDVGAGVRTSNEVSMWEQLSLAAFLQRHWADNQVSCTVTFDPDTEGKQLEYALDYFQYQLKGVSFLPKVKKGAYAQMPYEAIDEAEYQRRVSQLRPLHLGGARLRHEESNPERFCDGDVCSVDGGPTAGLGEAVPTDSNSVDRTIPTVAHPHDTQTQASNQRDEKPTAHAEVDAHSNVEETHTPDSSISS